jgi:hypothetical protein
MDELIQECAERHGVDPQLISRLIDYEKTMVHMERRRGAEDDLRRIIETHIEEQSP